MPTGARKRPRDTLVVNATCLGSRLDGIGIYTLGLLHALARIPAPCRIVVYLNESAARHVEGLSFLPGISVRWVSGRVSPDLGFAGHFLRILHANSLPFRHAESVIFAMSQMEACWFRRDQVVTVHDLIPLLFREASPRQYHYFRWVLPHVLRTARAVISPSEHTKALLVERYGLPAEKVRVIPHGVSDGLGRGGCEAGEESPEGTEELILYLGRIAPIKNVVGLIRAFALIRDRIPHTLVIAGCGHGRHTEEARAAARRDGADGRVRFTGPLPALEMARLVRKASVLVLPSFYEGFGLPPLEAMANGCPVVVSRAGSLPEVCGDAALYVDPYDTRSIGDGILTVLTDEIVRRRLMDKGRDRAARFQWETSLQQHLRVFGEVLSGE